MRLVSWNVNGLRAVHRKNLFVPFIDEYQPDILCLQETKAERSQSVIELPQYTEYWNSATKKGYSGTAIFTKLAPITVTPGIPEDIAEKFQLHADPFGDPTTEGRVIAAEYDKFILVTVYTPNAKDDLGRLPLRHSKWDPVFLSYLKRLESQKPLIFCGDLNVAHTADDLARPKENEGKKGFTSQERDGIQAYVDEGFVDTFRLFTKGNGHYTWWSHFANARARNIGWRIDYFFVSSTLASKVKAAEILAGVEGSDHCPVLIEGDFS